jgi:hypothetical protein
MLMALADADIRPDVITFADTGCEKKATYQQLHTMNIWLMKRGWPMINKCKLRTLKRTPYNDLAGNNSCNDTLPSLAMGKKGCSVKWKQKPQDYFLMGVNSDYSGFDALPGNKSNWAPVHPLWAESQRTGKKIIKLIGYDNGPADNRRSLALDKDRKDKDGNKIEDPFMYNYPLQDLGWSRPDCVQRIQAESMPVPIKSACYFCPASQKWEIWWLAATDQEQFMEALNIEHRAMMGKHSRWGKHISDKGAVSIDEATYGKEWEEFVNKPAKQWPTTSITVGLGRSFAWNHFARENGLVDRKTGAFIADQDHCMRMADKLRGKGGNAHDGRTC